MIDGEVIASRDLGSIENFDIVSYLVADPETAPEQFSGYNEAEIAAWEQGQWGYVVVSIVAQRNGIVLGHHYLNNCEHGLVGNLPINALDNVDSNMIAYAITDARKALAALVR